MARRRQNKSVDWLIRHIDELLIAFGEQRHDLDLRAKVQRLCLIYESVKDLGISAVREHGLDASAAVERLRLYLIEYTGQIIERVELEVVAGISEWARRVRQLRVEDGYQIASGASPDPEAGITLRPDQYLLVSPEPDKDAARRWHIANRIRRSSASSKHRVLEYLMENVGKVVTTDELSYVARSAKEFARRTRELRTEEGYAVATRFTGRPDLRVGQYVLQSKDRVAEPHDRRIPEDIQREVYARDKNTCRIDGWHVEDWSVDDPRILELHHIEHHRARGDNVAKNLIVLCSRCHDQVHAGQHTEIIAKIASSL